MYYFYFSNEYEKKIVKILEALLAKINKLYT